MVGRSRMVRVANAHHAWHASSTKEIQPNPIDLERFLQQRPDVAESQPKVESPRDSSLQAAVDRMTKEAEAHSRVSLIMTTVQWKKMVLSHMKSSQINDFSKEIVNRLGNVDSIEELNKWLGLAMNIWNNTPQPDRGGRSPNEIIQNYDIHPGG